MTLFHLGRPAAAATVLGAYERLSRRYGVRMPKNLEQSLAVLDPPEQIQAALDAQAYAEAHAAGVAMSIDDIVEFMTELANGTQGIGA